MVKQATLSEAVVSEAAENLNSSEEVVGIIETVKNLPYPEKENPKFDHNKWEKFYQNATSALAATGARETKEDDTEKILWATAMLKSGEKTLVTNCLDFVTSNSFENNSLIEKVQELTYHTLHRLPEYISLPLVYWTEKIHFISEDEMCEISDNKKGGYYDPETNSIYISSDSIWSHKSEPDGWPLSKPGNSDTYVQSVIIHELGHALHYMLGLQDKNTEEIDNSKRENWKVELKDIPVNEKQNKFNIGCIKAYAMLESGKYNAISTFSSRQEKTIEEFVAEGFCAWVTSPRYLKSEQYVLFSTFNSL